MKPIDAGNKVDYENKRQVIKKVQIFEHSKLDQLQQKSTKTLFCIKSKSNTLF